MKDIYERVECCPVCSSRKNINEIICKDFSITQESFTIVKCKDCGFKYTNPRPSEKQIGRYYQSKDYISHQDTSKGILNKVYYLVKQRTLLNKIKLINKIHTKGYLLDVGCGTGSFLEICKSNGWNIMGVEPDEAARKKALEKTNSEVLADLFELNGNEKFDVITLWHVLEHIHRLNYALQQLKSILSVNGKLVIAVPNVDSYDAILFREYWAAYDIPRHLYHFSKETIVKLMQNYQLKLEAVIPMTYDAYYISLLSGKYKFNKIDYLKAIKEGYLSNRWAKNNNKNYSSLTYIFSN